jgi:hypothetical protein
MMRIGWMVLALLLVSRHAGAADVTVCLAANGLALTAGATSITSSVFRKAGVMIEWQCSGTRVSVGPRTSLRIELVEGTPKGRLPGVLAISHPYARCEKGITVFYDRVRSLAHGTNHESALLGYVLAHEIAHVIQGIDRHSDTGVMKARWTEEDQAVMFQGRLGFEEHDVRLMRQGLTAGWCGDPTVLRARSESGIAYHPE